MPQILAVTETLTTLNQAEARFGLVQTTDPQFFLEWVGPLPEVTAQDQQSLDRIKAIYLYQRADGALAEGAINLLLTSPLLYLAGLCDPPFKIRAKVPVKVELVNGDTTLQGCIDALILQNRLWIVVGKSKRTAFPCPDAIPQLLACMMASPNPEAPSFGLVTNGDQFIFVKCIQTPLRQYDLSNDFSLFSRHRNELVDVLKILKRFKEAIQ